MSEQTIEQRVQAIMAEEFELEAEKLTAGANLYEELGLDSLDSVDLVVALEKEFQMKVDRVRDEDTVRDMRTLQDVYDFISSKLEASSA